MEEKEHPSRKQIRLPEFDYSENRMYFITICSKDKEKTFGRVVGDGACDKIVLRENDERTNKIIPKFISLFKRSCNHEIGYNIWQRSYYDHVLRNYQDYRCTWLYIDNNPARWTEDEYY